MFLLVALTRVITIIISLASIGTVRDQAVKNASGTGVSSSQMDTIVTGGVIGAIVFGVLFLIAFVLFAFFMRRGANWARIVLTVLTALSLLSVLGAYGVGALGVVAGIVAVVLMFLTPSNEYFRNVKARKTGVNPATGY
ncbi:hypothetical protein ASF23_11910 [Curtobacterium sp. Leaf261]|nr:hypothetical protein ASF23_11910 [Curtobacterium sp. Leaf261]